MIADRRIVANVSFPRTLRRIPIEDLKGKTIKAGVVAGAMLVLASIAACHGAPRLTAQETEGKQLYASRCAHCHEDNDLALKKAPPDLHGVFAHSTLPSGAPANDETVKNVVLNGKNLMPGFAGRFTDEQMAALLAYLHTGLR